MLLTYVIRLDTPVNKGTSRQSNFKQDIAAIINSTN